METSPGYDASSLDAEAVDFIPVSWPLLLLSAVPLIGLSFLSWSMDLHLESPIVVGVLRTFTQLSVLGFVLKPIFVWGVEHLDVVLGYSLIMVILASMEASARSKYYFANMYWSVLASFTLSVGVVSVFAFGVIIRPHPHVWEPQYVIPIVGMLLGNCINGVSLSLNSLLTNMVEKSHEIELYLSFGASTTEASSRLLREAVTTGAMPMLNSMRVIGLISIPGMMTGQILAGSAPVEAAKYQILIIQLIGMAAFGTIFCLVWVGRRVSFDESTGMLRSTEKLFERAVKLSFLGRLSAILSCILDCLFPSRRQRFTSSISYGRPVLSSGELLPLMMDTSNPRDYVAPEGTLEVVNKVNGTFDRATPVLELERISRSFPMLEVTSAGTDAENGVDDNVRTLFRDLNVRVYQGDVVAVTGPSGVGKSQLLRLIGGLSPCSSGDMWLTTQEPQEKGTDTARKTLVTWGGTQWRRQVRYVSQYKVDIPGTPRDFARHVTTFKSWETDSSMPPYKAMIKTASKLVQSWGLEVSCLDKEWKLLSGGEGQRVYVALALASQPRVLLLDESTSALDLDSKLRVEQSISDAAKNMRIAVVWITHDPEQLQRFSADDGIHSS